jgi:NitT/TauT family transport system substrate-binding protein
MKQKRRLLLKSAVAALALPFGQALAQTAKMEKLTLMTSFRVFGGDTPFFVGREKGYFSEQGIDLEILEGSGSSTTAKIVASRSAHVGLVDGGVVIRSVAEGLPIKVVAGYVQSSPLCIIVPKKLAVSNPKGLEGKRLGGTPGAAGEILMPGWLKLNGADPDKVQLISLASAARNATLIQGQVDGIVGFSNGDLLIIRDRGVDAMPIMYSDFGFNIPNICLVMNTSVIQSRPDLVRGVVAAWQRSVVETQRDIKAAVDILVSRGPKHLNANVEVGSVTETLKLLQTPRTKGRPYGLMAREDWEDAINLMEQYAGLRTKPRVEDVMTNEFLPAR